MKKLGKYSMGLGDRFGHQGHAQLKAITEAGNKNVEITPVWNKSNREHMIIGTQPSDVRKEADSVTRAAGFKMPYFVDADHINLETVDKFISSSDFFTIDVASYIGKRAGDSVISALKGEPQVISWRCSRECTIDVTGPVTGGNLSLIYSLTGTPAEPETDGSILFIEEVGEYYYHLDRMLTSLRLTGKLTNLAALVVGGMEKMTQGSVPYNRSIEEIVLDIVGHYSYPVVFNYPAGHISDNRAMFIGRQALLTQFGRSASLTYI